jgi:hypothetical protein
LPKAFAPASLTHAVAAQYESALFGLRCPEKREVKRCAGADS